MCSSCAATNTGTTNNTENIFKNLSRHFAETNIDNYGVWVHTRKALIGQLARPLLQQMSLKADRTEPVALLDKSASTGVLP